MPSQSGPLYQGELYTGKSGGNARCNIVGNKNTTVNNTTSSRLLLLTVFFPPTAPSIFINQIRNQCWSYMFMIKQLFYIRKENPE